MKKITISKTTCEHMFTEQCCRSTEITFVKITFAVKNHKIIVKKNVARYINNL